MRGRPLLTGVDGLAWAATGQATLWGPLRNLAESLDRRLAGLAHRWEVTELSFPPTLAAADLARIDYFRSFPHLATFPVCLDGAEENLARFTAGEPVDADGHVAVGALAPIDSVLTPAACYHLYGHLRGRHLDQATCFTTRATCFRREAEYRPLERQWSFTMRELICLGGAEKTQAFVDAVTGEVDALAGELGLPLAWKEASDPFFHPSRHPGFLMQQIDPTKRELCFDDDLAIASTNLHHDHFGRAFDITGGGEGPASSACVAFGIERWMAAILHHHGIEASRWPEVER